MPQKNRFGNNKNKRQLGRAASLEPRGLRRPPEPSERVAPTVYGKPFIVLEDGSKKTFVYNAGAWIPHSSTIAECRQVCQVKELPQRVNLMVRYEVRCPEE